MATLDVNRAVYSSADTHLVFAEKARFDALRFKMRWKLGVVAVLDGAWWAITWTRLPVTWQLGVAALCAVIVGSSWQASAALAEHHRL